MAIKTDDYLAFIKGQEDCEKGIKHQHGKGEYYDRGYATQYELEQVNNWMSEHGFR